MLWKFLSDRKARELVGDNLTVICSGKEINQVVRDLAEKLGMIGLTAKDCPCAQSVADGVAVVHIQANIACD